VVNLSLVDLPGIIKVNNTELILIY